ncbi:MAG: hypothetical protein E4G99_05440 [Anaerolineales bacterium]|nr:MAG: hypothetical protein E4G99_05440 [Anaerolineales bacterium]
MNIKVFLLWLITSILIASCGAVPADGTEFGSTQAGDLIRRNLLLGEGQYRVDDPLAFQYGNLHVDGPSGGILYRFSSNPDLLKWLIEHHGLHKNMIDSADQLPLDFLADRPRWWDPWKANPSAYYILVEEFGTGGERRFILVYDSATSVIYIVDHFADMPGI